MFLEQNPLPYLARFPEADVLTSSDQVIPTVTDDSLEVWQQGKKNSRKLYRTWLCFLFDLLDSFLPHAMTHFI